MYKRIYSIIIIMIALVTGAKAQFNVNGANPAWEGSSERYTLNVSGMHLPSGLNLQYVVTNGTILASQADPYGTAPLSVQVQWNCGVSSGRITIQDVAQGYSFSYEVSLYSFSSYANFCGTAAPATQTLLYAQTPAQLSVTDCSPYCTGTYNFTYQWQQAPTAELEIFPYQPSTWTDISGATSATYTPAAPTAYSVLFYRRITRFYNNGQLQTLYSAPVLISFLDYLQPGSLTGGGAIAYNGQPVIGQTAASGGQCDAANYVYTWESSTEGGPWQTIGTGINYPANASIVGNSRIRRKVTCGGEFRYTQPLVFTVAYTSPNTENLNYVRTNTISVPGVYTWAQADALPTGQKVQSTVYLDGFGRTVQQVTKQASYTGTGDATSVDNYQDIVGITMLDGLGRADKSYLPYATATNLGLFKTNILATQNAFNNTIADEPSNNPYTYSQQFYDGSPFNRVVLAKGPGYASNNDPQYLGISNSYQIYKATEGVRIWHIGFASNDIPTNGTGDVYANDVLIKHITKDDKGKQVIEYKNKNGQLVFKKVQEKESSNGLDATGYNGWLCTYYVYDDYGRLRYTLPPKVIAQMHLSNNWTVTNAMRDNLCFYQAYDMYGNVILKQSAGAGEVHSVYDSRNRLVMSQDANQRNRQQWSFSLYDENDRVVVTGLITDGRSRIAMQAFVSSLNAGVRTVQVFTGSNENITVYNPVAGTDVATSSNICSSCTGTTVNSVNYYDGYGTGSHTFETVSATQFAPLTAASGDVNPLPLTKSLRTRGMATGSKVRILDGVYDDGIVSNDHFLGSTVYYNEEGLALQTLTNNIKNGTDVSNVQYGFSGKVLGTYHRHGSPGTSYHGMITVTKTENDLLRRPLKNFVLLTDNAADIANSNAYKPISTAQYDALGRAKKTTIGQDPITTGQPLEIQDFTYNIQGQLIGINKDYALSQQASTQWDRRFGLYLGYDNRDSRFVAPQYAGQLTGAIWRSQGDNTPRKYDYEYDNINRFTKANFKQIDGFDLGNTAFTSATINLSAAVTSYDVNGNIQGMQQWGLVPGGASSSMIDDLQYSYFSGSNRLQSVSDIGVTGAKGDFKDVTGTTDYAYDANGNLTSDANKGITAITYNFLNLPQRTQIPPSGNATASITDYIYDAAGSMLAKTVTPLDATGTAGTPVTTHYVGSYVYQDNEVQYILFGGGRKRRAWQYYPDGTNALTWQWDYFITDHLGNVRTVLTEQTDVVRYTAGFETAQRPTETAIFANIETTAFPINLINSSTLQETNEYNGEMASRLNGSELKTGAAITLKVMAGDKVDIGTQYWYPINNATGTNPVNPDDLFTVLLNTLSGGASGLSGGKATPGELSTTGSSVYSGLQNFLNNHTDPDDEISSPKAYLNWILLDEQFKYVPSGSGFIKVGSYTESWTALASTGIPISKSGYLFVYLSNQTIGQNVFFDNLVVQHYTGPLMEENHYYPFGLKIAGISSRAALRPATTYGYQGIYNEEDASTGYNEFTLRSYDPQIGRWIQSDPFDVEPGMYNGMGNDPVNKVDPLGGFDWYKGKNSGDVLWQDRTEATITIGNEEFENIGSGDWTDPRPLRFDGYDAYGNWNMHDYFQVWKSGGKEFYIADQFGREVGGMPAKQAAVKACVPMQPTFWQKWKYMNESGLMQQTSGIGSAIFSQILYSTANDFYIVANNRGPGYYLSDLSGELVGAKERDMAGLNVAMWVSGPALKPLGTFAPVTDATLGAAKGVTVASSAGGETLPMTVEKILPQGSKITDIVNEIKGMTWVTGNEHAVVRLANGQKAIVSGGPGGISFQNGQIRTLFGHTHPTSAPPSLADFNALRGLGQSKQYVIHGGQTTLIRPY